MKILINAGHGGNDPGAVSKNNKKEKDITRIIASFLVGFLIDEGFDVEFYQQKTSVNEVVEVEKSSKSALVISLHCNSAVNSNASGVECLHYPGSGTGKAVAEIISRNVAEYLEIKNRGAKARKDLRVLSGTVAPAVIVEMAFLSNLAEEKMLVQEPYNFAGAIAKGVKEWAK